MLRLLAAKFSRSASVLADRVEWILADTDKVDPEIEKKICNVLNYSIP